jgi:hypothetical protein
MISAARTCNTCGHGCHCYRPDCEECHNDVCVKCDCKTPIEKETKTDARNWDNYLK